MRAGAALVDDDGKPVGNVTSGGFGPSAGRPVAMGYVAARARQARHAPLRRRSRHENPVDVPPLPFTPHRYRKG